MAFAAIVTMSLLPRFIFSVHNDFSTAIGKCLVSLKVTEASFCVIIFDNCPTCTLKYDP
jgi:hypothetical protein